MLSGTYKLCIGAWLHWCFEGLPIPIQLECVHWCLVALVLAELTHSNYNWSVCIGAWWH